MLQITLDIPPCHPGVVVDKRDIDKMWLDAQTDINKDLDDEGFQAEVLAKTGD
jgi:hypothetical protein